MSVHRLRIVGDPVLRQRAREVEDIDGRLVHLADEMVEVMYEEIGAGLAAPQIGVQRRLFVYDIGDGPRTVVNPRIQEADGEAVFTEGCLSVPGLSWEILRPARVHLVGYDLDGNEVSIEADEREARVFQHELDHLDGVLLFERLDEDQRTDALRQIREIMLAERSPGDAQPSGGLRLP